MSTLTRALKATRRAQASGAILSDAIHDIDPDMAAPIATALDDWNASIAALVPALEKASTDYNASVSVNVDYLQLRALGDA